MGLDIVLGLVILIAGVRGWLRGFMIQTIRLAGLVGCVYAAAPVRDLAKPYVATQFPTIRPELLDRILWWTSAVLVYVVAVGLASLIIKMQRRRPFGESEPNRTDQFAGFLLGGIKGALVVTFLVAGLQKYAVPRVKGIDWADEQASSSYALKWDGQYHPAERVWTLVPVQHFVGEVKRMGMPAKSSGDSPPTSPLEPEPVQAANAEGPHRLELELPKVPSIDPDAPDFTHQFDRIFDQLAPPAESSR
jgi:uncharacterized membrane protein required for colicin V production